MHLRSANVAAHSFRRNSLCKIIPEIVSEALLLCDELNNEQSLQISMSRQIKLSRVVLRPRRLTPFLN
jgi:hypothetical protein